MDREREERIARNEAAFRKVNEAIAAGRDTEGHGRVAFLCECGALGCNRLVELSPPEYEGVRADPRRFLLIEGHEEPEVEEVVEVHDRYIVVAKREPTAAIVEATDPRS